jgi:hypothetical protein
MIAFLMGSLAFRVGSGSFDSIEHEGLKIAPCVGGMHMSAESASELIDQRIEEFGDWRGALLMHIREMIKAAVPEVIEEWKWRGTPTWYHHGMICTGETYKQSVKVTFAKGASLDDPTNLFNASLDGNVRRAIDLYEGDALDEAAFMSLVRAAVALNVAA